MQLVERSGGSPRERVRSVRYVQPSHRRSAVIAIAMLSWSFTGCQPESTITPNAGETPIEPADRCLPDSWRPALDVPPHADLDFDPHTALWADVVRSGPLYPAAEGPPFPAEDLQAVDEPVSYEVGVLDSGDESSDRRRLFLLCDEISYRIGFWQAAEDLRHTNRSHALLVGQPRIPESVSAATPGIRFPPGAVEVEITDDASSVRATYEDGEIRAEGWISAELVDIVIERETPAEQHGSLVDGVLVMPEITVWDAPDGVAFAWLSVSTAAPTWVRRLDESPGFVLVRLLADADPNISVVGWIDVEAFEARSVRIATARPGKGGSGGIGGSRITTLEPGTLLVHEASELVVGVVNEAEQFWCVEQCEEPAPRVEVYACEHEFRVRAIRPATSPRLCPS